MEYLNQSNLIHLLPEHLVNQIKAGEVIERPATLLKELLENSIDAKSTKINIQLINNGLDLIQVTDNGVGIDYSQLPLAFCRHATSKIDVFEDLYKLHTYGFRGEALASVASISKLTCSSITKDLFESTIKIEGGKTVGHYKDEVKNKKPGTNIFVKDLFFNTPARLKFVQSATSEKNQLNKIINAFLLTHYNIEFSIKIDDKEKKIFQSCASLKERVSDIFKKSIKDTVLLNEVEQSYDGAQFKILFSEDSNRGNAGKKQFIFINNRIVFDKQIHQIILHSLQNFWELGSSGNYSAYVYIPSDQIDINVHPNKTIVKFHQPGKIFSLISSTIKSLTSTKRSLNNSAASTQINFEKNQSHYSTEFNYSDISSYQADTQQITDLKTSQFQIINDFGANILIRYYGTSSKFLILNKTKLLKNFFDSGFIEKKFDLNSIPLLVSKPIRTNEPIERLNLKLELLGIDIDRLNKDTIVTRSIPQFISRLSNDQLIYEFLKTLRINQDFEEFVKNFTPTQVDMYSNADLERIIDSCSEYVLNCQELTDKDLSKLLK